MAYDWNARAKAKQRVLDRMDNTVIANVSQAYDRVIGQLDKDIDRIFAAFGKKNGLTPSAARAFLTANTKGPYGAQVSRIKAIQQAARQGMMQVADVELPMLTQHLKDVADQGYGQMMYDVQKATGYGFKGVGVPADALKSVLNSKWSGQNYSSRIWGDRDVLAKSLGSIMLEHASMGKLSELSMLDLQGMVDVSKWKKTLKGKFKDAAQYAKYAAERLVRTESSFVNGQANAMVYDECMVEKYVFIAVLDTRTSSICQDHDGEEYAVDDQEVGVNFPPMHPFCRSTTGALIDDVVIDNAKRRARKADGTTELVPRDMKYPEWKQWQDAGAPDLQQWRAISQSLKKS